MQTTRRWFLMQRLGGTVGRAGQNCPYYQTKPDLTPNGQLSPQKSRYLSGSHTKTLRPIVSQTASEASPVLCLKERAKYDTTFESVDYVLEYHRKLLILTSYVKIKSRMTSLTVR